MKNTYLYNGIIGPIESNFISPCQIPELKLYSDNVTYTSAYLA